MAKFVALAITHVDHSGNEPTVLRPMLIDATDATAARAIAEGILAAEDESIRAHNPNVQLEYEVEYVIGGSDFELFAGSFYGRTMNPVVMAQAN